MRDIGVLIVKHEQPSGSDYSLVIGGEDFAIQSFSHGYPHKPGNHGNVTFQGISLEDMEEMSKSIIVAVKEKREAESVEVV